MCCGQGGRLQVDMVRSYTKQGITPILLDTTYRVQFCGSILHITFVAFSCAKLAADRYRVFLNGRTCFMSKDDLLKLKIPKVNPSEWATT